MFDTETTTEETTTVETTTSPKAPVVLTKEEKLAKLDKEIARLIQKRDDIANDRIPEAKAKKEVVLPEVGADVLFSYGRKTATTEPVEKLGRVVAIKPASTTAEGKKLPAQLKVSIGEGFDQEFVVIYPAQILNPGNASE